MFEALLESALVAQRRRGGDRGSLTKSEFLSSSSGIHSNIMTHMLQFNFTSWHSVYKLRIVIHMYIVTDQATSTVPETSPQRRWCISSQSRTNIVTKAT